MMGLSQVPIGEGESGTLFPILSNELADIKKWHKMLVVLSTEVPAADHKKLAAALAKQDRQAKGRMRRDMGLE